MIGTLFYVFGALLMVGWSAAHVNSSYQIFWDPVGILLVVGGTVFVSLITFGPKEVFILIRTSFKVMGQNGDDAPLVATEIIALARDTRGNVNDLQQRLESIKFPFLRDGIILVCERLDERKIEQILRDRIKVKQEMDESTANMLRTLAKYPPSFGIIGTVLGLIALMMQLGTDGGAARLGPAMAVGLVATLYGLVLTNFVLQPVAENLQLKSYKDIRKRQIAMVGVMLIKNGETSVVIQEAINSMLPVAKRVDVLGLGDGSKRNNEEAA